MYLKILNDDFDASKSIQSSNNGPRGSMFNGYLIRNNPITVNKRQYYLEVEGLPYSFPGHKDHKLWLKFLEANPHIISNFDTRDHGKLSYLFDRWKLTDFR